MTPDLIMCELRLYADTLSDHFSIKTKRVDADVHLVVTNQTSGYYIELPFDDPDIIDKSHAWMKPKVDWKIFGDTPH